MVLGHVTLDSAGGVTPPAMLEYLRAQEVGHSLCIVSIPWRRDTPLQTAAVVALVMLAVAGGAERCHLTGSAREHRCACLVLVGCAIDIGEEEC